MSTKDLTIDLINSLDDVQMQIVLNFVKFLKDYGDGKFSQDTIDAISEVNSTGQHFQGSTEDFFEMMMNE